MIKLVIILAVLVVLRPEKVWAQEDPSRSPCLQEGRRRDSDLDRPTSPGIGWRETSPDLWYGTPAVRAGGDLLVPLIDLIRRPSSLLDFSPRKVPRD
jgi:hypothetical protein